MQQKQTKTLNILQLSCKQMCYLFGFSNAFHLFSNITQLLAFRYQLDTITYFCPLVNLIHLWQNNFHQDNQNHRTSHKNVWPALKWGDICTFGGCYSDGEYMLSGVYISEEGAVYPLILTFERCIIWSETLISKGKITSMAVKISNKHLTTTEGWWLSDSSNISLKLFNIFNISFKVEFNLSYSSKWTTWGDTFPASGVYAKPQREICFVMLLLQDSG